MGVIEPKHRRVELPARAQRSPGKMIGVARLDDVGTDVVEQVKDELGVKDEPVAGGITRKKVEPRRADGVEMEPPLALVRVSPPGMIR